MSRESGSYRIGDPKQQFVAIGRVSEKETKAKVSQVDYLLLGLDQKPIEQPEGVGIVDFIRFEGKAPAQAGVAKPVADSRTLCTLRDRFLEARKGGRAKSTQYTSGIHFKHLVATLGERFPLPELTRANFQRHIGRRAERGVSSTTISNIGRRALGRAPPPAA